MNQVDQLPVWIVRGPNWMAKVPLDEYNAQFDISEQLYEAASQAIETQRGFIPTLASRIEISLDEGEETFFLSPVLNCFPIDGSIAESIMIMTHVALANNGQYKESIKMAEILKKEIKKFKAEALENGQKLANDFTDFEKLVEEMNKKKNKPSPPENPK